MVSTITSLGNSPGWTKTQATEPADQRPFRACKENIVFSDKTSFFYPGISTGSHRKTLNMFYHRKVLNSSNVFLTYRMETGQFICRSHNPRTNTSFRKRAISTLSGNTYTSNSNKTVQHNLVAKTNKILSCGTEGDSSGS